jgi:hypothetical protein
VQKFQTDSRRSLRSSSLSPAHVEDPPWCAAFGLVGERLKDLKQKPPESANSHGGGNGVNMESVQQGKEPVNGQLIYSAIPKIMNDVGAIGKSRKNLQQNYSFRGIDDMYNAIQPALVKHGVFCVPEVTSREREERPSKNGGVLFYTTLTVHHKFFASDGSYVDVVTVGEAMDSGDKSTNKAMSAAMKYALIELLCIPTEDDKDTENQTHEPAAPARKETPALITDEQAAVLGNMLAEAEVSEKEFCSIAKITFLENLPQAKFENAKSFIQNLAKKKKDKVA